MGNKVLKQRADLGFMGAGQKCEKDKLQYYFDNQMFGETADDRYNYFDELVNDDEDLVQVLFDQRINWPSSIEALENRQFVNNLTEEQARAVLKVLIK